MTQFICVKVVWVQGALGVPLGAERDVCPVVGGSDQQVCGDLRGGAVSGNGKFNTGNLSSKGKQRFTGNSVFQSQCISIFLFR